MESINIIQNFDKNIPNQKIKKIYNQGDIIISYPGPSNEIYQLKFKPNIQNDNLYKTQYKSKSLGIKNNSPNKNRKYKTIKKQVEEMYNQIQQEIDEMDSDEESKKQIGYILKDLFTDEELSDTTKISPYPLRNIINSLNQNNEKEIIKPYIPDLQVNNKNEIIYKPTINNNENNNIKIKVNKSHNKETKNIKKKEVNLQKIIDICKENEKIINKINELYSKFLREEKIKEEKKRMKELKQMIKNKKIKQMNDSLENIKEDEKGENNISKSEQNKNDKIIIKDKEKIIGKDLEKKKYIYEKKDLVKIIDITKDKKYIEAKKYLKNSKENYEKTNDLIMEINHKIKEDKKSIGNSDYKANKKPKIEFENKAKKIIEQVKLDINYSYDNSKRDNNNN